MVNQCFPGSPSLAIATTQFRHIVPAVGEAQFFTESVKVLSSIETLEKLLLSQRTFDLSGGVAFHRIPPGLGSSHDTLDRAIRQDSRLVTSKFGLFKPI
jgi:hypothetical protein